MQLRGQAENGYAMAALLVAMSVMAVLMTVAMPAWKQASQREKEEELVFRGEQYAHAIGLFKRKYANASPPSLDVLVEQRFLRRKFKDPITKDDFQPLTEGGASGQLSTSAQSSSSPGQTATSPFQQNPSSAGRGASPFTSGPGVGGSMPGTVGGGIIGVTSKSKDKSIRLYKGRNHYNEWAFVFTQQTQAPGAGVPGAVAPGQRGQPGQQSPQGPIGSPFDRGGRGRGRGTEGNQPGGERGAGRSFNPNPNPTPFGPNRGRGPGTEN